MKYVVILDLNPVKYTQAEFRILVVMIITCLRTFLMFSQSYSYDSCARIYMFMKYQLHHESTEPIGAPDIGQFRLVDMFCSCTEEIVKNDILMAFSSPNSNLRIVIATIAFGMGLDCPNVRRIIHWGPSDDIELYMQETGRGGRDMAPAQALLYYGGPNLVVRHVDESMKKFIVQILKYVEGNCCLTILMT